MPGTYVTKMFHLSYPDSIPTTASRRRVAFGDYLVEQLNELDRHGWEVIEILTPPDEEVGEWDVLARRPRKSGPEGLV